MSAFHSLHSLLFALTVLASVPAWAQTTETQRCIDSEAAPDEPVRDGFAALSGNDPTSSDPPFLGIDNTRPTLAAPMRNTGLNSAPCAELISVSHHWSYWPQAPPYPVIV
ncbi:hypothetical protein [Saccharospirillum salsuginis]|uniref:Uncharacterized protein n=1 Tax=Saccharospirillum salsuginis TaxID=418750 RepID=A0A918NDK4_9GAMM|nr:hypothetical protein [Saccharospirillum salsuginis]GGX59403.1 hypothetical protein GCM10007392_29120 [Saccharospirillum salsuginis]